MIGESTRILVQNIGYKKVSGCPEAITAWNGNSVESINIEPTNNTDCIKVRLINGVELITNKDQQFSVRKKGNILASELDTSCLLRLNSETFKFDYLDLNHLTYLSKLNNFDLGVLLGFFYNLSGDGKILDIPLVRKEVRKALEYLFKRLEIKFTKTEYYKRADRVKYEVEDEQFLIELKPFLVQSIIPEIFWNSKALLEGFLKVVFTFSAIAPSMFTLRADKNTFILKDIQQALLLFGINSTYTKGLRMSQLLIIKNNRYNLVNRIGAFNAERFFEGVDFKKFLRYSDKDTIDTLYTKVHIVENVEAEMLYTISGQKLMANGVILENYE